MFCLIKGDSFGVGIKVFQIMKQIVLSLLSFTLSLMITEAKSQNSPSLAPVFGDNGHIDYLMQDTVAGAFSKCHAMYPDGKIILGGYNSFSGNNSYITSLLKIDPVCGNPDSSFGTNGFVSHVFEQRTVCNDITLQEDGKIVGCGLIAPSNAGSQQQAGLFRFNSNGTVDNNFNGQGYIKLSLLNILACEAHKVFIDAQNKIMVLLKGGSIGNPAMAIYRFNTNGQPDSTYGVNGQVIFPYNYAPTSNSVYAEMNSDSSITLVSLVGLNSSNSYIAVGKVDKNGLRDSTFNSTGYREYPELDVTNSIIGSKGYDLAFLSDGRFIISIGKNTSSGSAANLVAFLPNGDIDSSFGTNGIFSYSGNGAVNGGIYVDEEDKILIFTSDSPNGPGAVLRVLPNGNLDADFGINGLIISPFNPQPTTDNRKFNDGLILPNGDIFAYGGRLGIGFCATRYSFNPAQDALPQIVQNGTELSTAGLGNFQWFFNGTEISGATGNSLNISSVGTYTVSMGFEYCTFTSEPFEVMTIGTNDLNNSKLKIRNNPTKDYIYIENAPENIIWEIFSMEGKRILSGIKNTNGNIDLNSLTPGVYLIRCTNELEIMNFKIVKQ